MKSDKRDLFFAVQRKNVYSCDFDCGRNIKYLGYYR